MDVSEPRVSSLLRRLPFVGVRAARLYVALRLNRTPPSAFGGSQEYWRRRYRAGGDSGRGSYGKFAAFKADVLNEFVREHDVGSVIEFGCGDGSQLALAEYPRYAGYDVSDAAIELCRARFAGDATKTFAPMSDYAGEQAELALSLDVIYHLVEDAVFDDHMRVVFGAGQRFVIVYSTNDEELRPSDRAHVRHRNFTSWIEQNASDWELYRHVPSPYRKTRATAAADFFVYARRGG
jgi:SAM-dependent methyltransferase